MTLVLQVISKDPHNLIGHVRMAARDWTIQESKVHGDFVYDRWTRCATWPPYHVLSLTTFSSFPVPQPLPLSLLYKCAFKRRIWKEDTQKEIAIVQVLRVGLHECPRPKKLQNWAIQGVYTRGPGPRYEKMTWCWCDITFLSHLNTPNMIFSVTYYLDLHGAISISLLR